ncbi:glycosyltransferase family 2 protein [Halobacillus sp. B29]|uniref:glycosyltransferase family 2 protein n=1 Tax=Halobacillus sp. B29 TaxID=3457432 RepID=UPI003FCC74CE
MFDLSIIIPHYNSPQSLKRLLNSIPNEPNIEVIVVDDNSSYESQYNNLKKKYEKYENVLFVERKNILPKGAGKCRNIGLSKAKGKYVLFADADDYFVNDFFSTITPYFKQKYDIIFFTPDSFDENKKCASNRHTPYKNLIRQYLSNPDLINELELRYKFHVPWSKMVSREFLLKNNIAFDEVSASNDVMFSTYVGYFMRSFKVSKEVIYVATKNESSLTTRKENTLFDIRVKVFIRYYKFLKANLDQKEFKLFGLSGARVLFSVLYERRGLKQFFSVLLTFLKNNIKLFRFRDLKYINRILR